MELKLLIEKATEIAGSQRKLAGLLEMNPSNLIEMKNGMRPCNWRVRGKLRAILGEDPAHAFMAAMTEDLEQSENADELQAAESFKAMLAAFPEATQKTKNPADPKINGVSAVWRNRKDSTRFHGNRRSGRNSMCRSSRRACERLQSAKTGSSTRPSSFLHRRVPHRSVTDLPPRFTYERCIGISRFGCPRGPRGERPYPGRIFQSVHPPLDWPAGLGSRDRLGPSR
jgi:hypothetical protein